MRNHKKIRLIIVAAVLIAVATEYSPAANPGPGNPSIQQIRMRKEQKKQQRQADIKRFEKKIEALKEYTIEEIQLALTVKVIGKYEGASVMSDQRPPVYLGLIADEFNRESIFNIFERYGSEFNPMSIWNPFGTYGGSYSRYSPFNMFAMNPPVIVKDGKIIGRLTINDTLAGAVDPNWLKLFFRY
jgi:hypothetical protein